MGRAAELAAIDRLLAGARTGASGAVVIRGEAGIGKSALLDYAADSATDMRVLRASGVESEAEIAFGALHLLLHSELDLVASLPDMQATALRAALGVTPAPANDRLLVGLAVLTLLSDLAEDAPLLVLIDDAHWFDQSSTSALLFAARRLAEDRVVMIFAARDDERSFAGDGLPHLRPSRLDNADSSALLSERRAHLSLEIRQRVTAEAAGNPLALLELSGALTAEQRPGELPPAGLPVGMHPVGGQVQSAFRAQIELLPEATRTILLVAAADDLGEMEMVVAAARRLGAAIQDFEPAERAGLITVVGNTVAFRHPLVRAAAYHLPPFGQRLAAHAALAAACDTPEQADRHAWHQSASVVEPDDEIAEALERTAERARRRGGHATVARAYERSADLSVDESNRAHRLRMAAVAARDAGLLPRAASLLERASTFADDPVIQATLAPVRATVEFEYGSPSNAARALIGGAKVLQDRDPAEAMSMLSTAMGVALLAGDRMLADQVVAAFDALPPAVDAAASRPAVVARGVALLLRDDPARALRLLEGANLRKWGEVSPGRPRSVLLAAHAAASLGDDVTMHALTSTQVAECRRRGLIGMLPEALLLLSCAELLIGRHRNAMATAEEGLRIVRDTGQARELGFQALVLAPLAAIQGDDVRCRALAGETIAEATERGLTAAVAWSRYALGLLDLGLGRYDSAFEQMSEIRHLLPAMTFTHLADQIEAAFRAGRADRLETAFTRFRPWAEHASQPWARGVVARCYALTSSYQDVERHYATAVRLHAEGGRPLQRARTHLLFGEWLRRSRRPTDARTHLRAALEIFERLEATPWIERAASELRAAGEVNLSRRGTDPLSHLTPQELQVVRMAATGATNREIAGQLFLSPRTVGYHLYKAYPKLGVSSRRDLAHLDLDTGQ